MRGGYKMSSIINECNVRILKYKEQIEGLESFKNENSNGVETFTAVTVQRRNQINTSLEDTIKHPMAKKLHGKIYNAIDKGYENSVVDNFYEVKKEIIKAINQLLDRIDEEKDQISKYRRKIEDIIEEERREAERREAEKEKNVKL
jgi:tryptophanyl-tRNA synthetase